MQYVDWTLEKSWSAASLAAFGDDGGVITVVSRPRAESWDSMVHIGSTTSVIMVKVVLAAVVYRSVFGVNNNLTIAKIYKFPSHKINFFCQRTRQARTKMQLHKLSIT